MDPLAGITRLAITGTAPSWALTPWADPTIAIASLNDAYNIDGFQRADVWYDLHPLDKFYFAPIPQEGKRPVIFAHTVPAGYYVRPGDHVNWLAAQAMPKFLHPDFATQLPAAATWPNVHPFPKAEIEAAYGPYCTSSPQWMLAHAMLHGIREIHIYGIHLSTEQEYIEQRPGFEFLIGCFLGPSKRTLTVQQGLRRYESQDGLLVLPEASPVLASNFQYAFQPSPRRRLEPLKWELHKAEIKRDRTVAALKTAWGPFAKFEEPIPADPEGKSRVRWARVSTLQQELWHYEALVQDCHDVLARAQMGG